MADWERRPAFDLSGKRALVVGFGNPAGRAIALALAEAGAAVAAASATLDGDEVMAAKGAAKAVQQLGRESFAQGWDVTLPTNIQVGLKQLIREFGHPTILVYNAEHHVPAPIEKVTDAEFARSQHVNLTGAFSTARSFLRELPQGATGRLIFVTSMFGDRGVANMSAYASARGGINGLVATLSQEAGRRGVTANAIATGWMDWTPARGPADAEANRLLRYIPLGRFGTGEDIAVLATLIAGDAAGFMNGQVFHVDGGVSVHL
jgi:3-oxoacyl-[acyl-carrier protein] reductase